MKKLNVLSRHFTIILGVLLIASFTMAHNRVVVIPLGEAAGDATAFTGDGSDGDLTISSNTYWDIIPPTGIYLIM